MAGIRSNSDIIKGSMLMVFMGESPIGFATSHALNITTNTTEVSTKDNGDFASIIPQNISWEITAENLYSDAGEQAYMTAQMNKTLVTLKFAKAGNYESENEKGVIGNEEHGEWTVGTIIAQGQAYITSFSINAPAGENATMSVTFTGVGELKTNTTPTQGTQGN